MSTDFDKNVCGVSVLDDSFERLKRYNLAEIYSPTPVSKAAAAIVEIKEGTPASPTQSSQSETVERDPAVATAHPG
jgi:hypothetical protein